MVVWDVEGRIQQMGERVGNYKKYDWGVCTV